MKLSVTDVASIGVLVCAVTLTGVVLRRELATPSPTTGEISVRPRADVQLVGQVIGAADAPVPVVVFGDFQCPYCARAQPILKEILRAYEDRVKIVYRHLPLEAIHPHAWTAALAAECAAEQGAFAAFHDLLYSVQDSIGTLSWKNLAARAGVRNRSLFEDCLAQERHAGSIERDILLARDLRIDRTPTFIVGDAMYLGLPPVRWLEQRLAAELERAAVAPP